jgi:transcriptional regulator with XRE-family HTH domain
MCTISKLKELRFYSGMTQSEVANKLKISQNYWSYLERGVFKPSEDLQKRIKVLFETDEIYK